MKSSQSDARLNHLGWESYLIKPIQRLGKYELLLRDLLKHTEANHPAKTMFKHTLDYIIKLLKQNDEVMQCSIKQSYHFRVYAEF